MPTPIATFLSTYGPGLANFFNISSKIPLMCAVNPDGTALGGPGTVGDEDFIANFSAAGGGGDLLKAFDLSGPIPLVCMVNPDGTAYSPVSYTELTFTWWQSSTSAPVILQTLVNTTGLTITAAQRQAAGQLRFRLSGTLSATAGKVTIFVAGQNDDATAARIFNPSTTGTDVFVKVFDAAGTNVDNVGNGTTLYASTTIRIYQ